MIRKTDLKVRSVALALAATAPILAMGRQAQAQSAQPAAPTQTPTVEVVGTTPVQGTGVDRLKVPSNIQTVDPAGLSVAPQTLNNAIADKVGSAAAIDSQGNEYNSALSFRGFTASPLLGQPQGLAVYQNGVRQNDPFGDVVNWVTIPSFAIKSLELIPGSNPVFGLNALGGAVSLQMKDGFNSPGGSADLFVGSHKYGETLQYGLSSGKFAVYGGQSTIIDNGWRNHSASNIYQGYLDLAARTDKLDAGLSLTAVSADLTGNGASPKEQLQDNYNAVFTVPDDLNDKFVQVAGRSNYQLDDVQSLQGTVYYRYNRAHQVNGDTADFDECESDVNEGFLCQNAGEDDEELLRARNGDLFDEDDEINGIYGKTLTESNGVGTSGQYTNTADLFGHENNFVVGASLDFGFVSYLSDTKTAELNQSRNVAEIGQLLGGDDFNTRLDAQNQYYGLYAADTFSITPRLALSVAGRLNYARINLDDDFGSDLNGTHHYARLNPSIGLTYQAIPDYLNAYVSYSEANRTPTAAELACSDPDRACRLPNAFTADPDLDQVISHTFEVGARGKLLDLPAREGQAPFRINYSAAVYDTINQDDIIFVSSGAIVGSGYFRNAGTTNRLGTEIGLDGSWGRFGWFANYGFVHATFGSSKSIASPNNPEADDDDNIQVHSGDRIPGIPQHTFKFGMGYAITDGWSVAADGRLVSGSPYQGDEANEIGNTPGYAIFNAQTTWRVRKAVGIQFRIENIFDKEYYTYGILGEPDEVFEQYDNSRFLTPGQGRTFELAMHITF